jgi:AcrR family transcriptional regulator
MSRKSVSIDIEKLTEQDGADWNRGMNQKQKQILETSERLFGEQGYAHTATAQIAKEAGITERTLFKYFPSKAEQYKQVLIPVLMRFLAPRQFKELRELTERDYASYEEFLLIFFSNRAAAFKAHSSKVNIVLQELLSNESFRSQFTDVALKNTLRPTLKLLERFQENGMIRDDIHPEVLLRVQVTSVLSYFLVREIFNAKTEGLTEQEEIQQMVAILAQGVVRA